ncbi:50S ribosomal protein L25/general stress protein Ctc [uncultured Thiodictyon sp.]|uniref:50S ribosomal protein L25/general stress protein Ctc n=1 Tax=uncultured Thiodictyon sp. TaxID=1846217 RepID=UPI0025F41617|nr:50S ribosomal protein L25/general stress protein Ctc [uncultured Thiodictyon sp.]
MSVNFDVFAESRSDTGKGASRRLRRQGLIPAIVYGGHQEPVMISLRHNQILRHLEHESFYSHVLNLKIGDVESTVVLKDLQRHPAKPFILHADFLRVSQDEKLRMVVPLHFLNVEQSPGIKAGGNASHALTEIEITCLPKDLPEYIVVNVAAMAIGDIIHLAELPLPEGVTLAHTPDADEPVVVMHGPRAGAETTDEAEGGA